VQSPLVREARRVKVGLSLAGATRDARAQASDLWKVSIAHGRGSQLGLTVGRVGQAVNEPRRTSGIATDDHPGSGLPQADLGEATCLTWTDASVSPFRPVRSNVGRIGLRGGLRKLRVDGPRPVGDPSAGSLRMAVCVPTIGTYGAVESIRDAPAQFGL
jgi:hypothetical protein